MPISMMGTQTLGETASGTTVAVAYPAGVTSGELLLAKITTTANNVSTVAPTGWTLAIAHQNTTAGTVSSAVWYRVATGSLTGNVTFNGASAAGRLTVTMERWAGVDTTTPFDVTAITSGITNNTVFNHPGITTVTNGAVVIYTISHNISTAVHVTSGNGLTKIGNGPSSGVGREQAIFMEERATAGATGTRTFNSGSSSQWGGIAVALRPASTPAGPAYTASASFGGSGSLSAAAKAGLTRSVALSGSGGLSAVLTGMSAKGTASFGSFGILSATGVDTTPPPVVVTPYVKPKPTYTAPYAFDAETRIRYTHRQAHTATIFIGETEVVLDVVDGTVTLDDSSVPRIQAQLICKIPESKAVLDSIDSRLAPRVVINAGYIWNSVEKDIHLLANLHLRDIQLNRPDNLMNVTLASDEALAIDMERMAWTPEPPQNNLIEVVRHHVGLFSIGEEPEVRSDYLYDFGASAVAGLIQEPGTSSWEHMNEAAARATVSIYCDSDRTWRIAKPQALSSVNSLNFNTGGGGILTQSNSTSSRDRFYNAVCIKYAWKDEATDTDHVVYGQAVIEAGPLAPTAIPYRVKTIERDIPVTQSQADAAATTALISLSRRGRSHVLYSVNAFWLRPGQTVTATVPNGDQERLLVSAVEFNLTTGAMTVRVRQPEDIQIINS